MTPDGRHREVRGNEGGNHLDSRDAMTAADQDSGRRDDRAYRAVGTAERGLPVS